MHVHVNVATAGGTAASRSAGAPAVPSSGRAAVKFLDLTATSIVFSSTVAVTEARAR
ncbi:hypothetical protein ACFVJI_24110 [Streptomyces sp. NPDC127584]|uniref:hypothetical protein n=1 Tax=Streptomyces sp. NPDC127584 TaxID=3345403 RepID=UPI0036294AC3